jgi:hypothetical protein
MCEPTKLCLNRRRLLSKLEILEKKNGGSSNSRENTEKNWACVSVCQESGNIGWPRDLNAIFSLPSISRDAIPRPLLPLLLPSPRKEITDAARLSDTLLP